MNVIFHPTNLKAISSAKCGKCIEKCYFPQNVEEIDFVRHAIGGGDYVFLGAVTNTLVLEEYDGAAIFTDALKGVSLRGNELKVASGESLSKLSGKAFSLGLGGMENFYGLPGTVGGAVSGNAGCFGKTISENLLRVELYNFDTQETETLEREEIAFSYRKCNLRKNKDLILSATFLLYPEDRERISDKMSFVRQNRQEKQPKGHSFGSYFKNYNGVSAGYYIEQVGLKGYERNGVKVSEKHANFLLNISGNADDYYEMGEFVRKEVYEKTGVKLEREVIVVGEENRKRNR
ncbi:MAG: UDP-N-acetylmuramate dehydrogenase [Clostridia bacterium]|nr:UDP-N-acetylmuramate dehydrogenase [Clostridia bacterium]